MRQLVESELSKISDKWWVQRVPQDVRFVVKKRIARDERLWPWHPKTSKDPISYIDFADYIKIITRRDNWREIFKDVFRDEKQISSKLQELIPIRIKIAHPSRGPLTEAEKQILIVNARSVLVSIWSFRINRSYVEPALRSMEKGEYSTAEKLLRNGFEETHDGWIAFNLGRVCEAQGRLAEAKGSYKFAELAMPLPHYKKMAVKAILGIDKKLGIISGEKSCPKCDTKMPEAYNFCGICGYRFDARKTHAS